MKDNKLILVADASVAHFYIGQQNKITERVQTIVFDKGSSVHYEHIEEDSNLSTNTLNYKSELTRENKENERQNFSSTVVNHLSKMCQEKTYTNITIIAEPKFLGDLRKNFDKQIIELIEKEIAKDLIHADVKDIELHLQ